ncbi:MAG: FAD-dependent oxidoreductase [Jatrophihabitans sp.]|uniref:FAD-dependent oxidoreductase n=1 Tax=Jatrophihabitans sp. TaxID=1932789 RepID=UPI003F7DF71B
MTRTRPGRDKRAEHHPAHHGASDDGRTHHVAVLGGGVAGLAAATALAERGVAVTLLEQHEQLGGRVRAWPVAHADGPATMSRGFHAFFRQYYNLRALLRRVDPSLRRLVPVADYPLLSADGFEDSFARIPRRPPWNLITFVLQSKTFTLADLKHIDGDAATELLNVDFPRTFEQHDGESAADYLDRLRFPTPARHLALEVFARSFFAHPSDFAAGELIAMFHAYFLGSAEGLLFDVPDDDYDSALWAPLAGHLRQRGVDVRTGTAVEAVASSTTGVEVLTSTGVVEADAVVVATDLATTQGLLLPPDATSAGDDWRERLAALRMAPPFAVHRLWFDRPAASERPPFLGTAGFGRVDNISVLERFEAGAATWAARTGGSVVELHAYALDDTDEAGLRAEMRATLDRLYPEYAHASVVADEFLLNADCPLVGVEPWARRPGVSTPDPRIVLAGDGIRCDFPVALMERAATTGFLAANELLQQWRLAGHGLWTVPLRSRTWLGRHARGPQAIRAAASGQRSEPVRTR